jgi:CubicO group peptidase (beta-lactamase class C family)
LLLLSLIPQLMEKGDVPGLVIVTIGNGKIQSQRAYGVANAETRQPLAPDATFESASLTKPVFAYAVLKLADAGVLSLDVPLATYLPEELPDARMKEITARMVLTHTTGLQNEVMPGETARVHFPPGSRFSYSGAAFLYLQRVVEHLTRRSLPALMRELVFEPLRMQASGYVWIPAYERSKVYGHTAAGTVRPRRQPAEAMLPMLHTTAGDYARFVIATMKGTGLRRSTARAMLTPQIAVDEGCSNCLGGGTGRMSRTLSWGLGWGLERTARGDAFWHWGENNGEIQNYALGYRDGTGVVILTNSGNGFSILPEVLAAALGGEHPSLAWMGYDAYTSPARVVWREVVARGAAAALASPVAATLTESQVNRIGYMLLETKRHGDAVALFRFNTARFPDSFNAWDSLGEAWAANGDREQAIVSYRRSLELNAGNTNAVEMLRKLQ